MTSTYSLTGDPEIDSCLPTRPRVLPEITWVALSSHMALAAGSLSANLFPTRIGNTSLFQVLSCLDGSRTLAEAIDDKGPQADDFRKYTKLLFSAGLLESSCASPSDLAAFHALAMDQTRLHNNRDMALSHSRRPVLVDGAPPLLESALEKMAVNTSSSASDPGLAFRLLILQPNGTPLNEGSTPHPSLPCLPVRLHGTAIDIGPWLPPKGGCQLRDLQHCVDHRDSESATSLHDEQLLYLLAAHAISLIVGGLSPIVLSGTAQRIRLESGGPVIEQVAVSPVLSDLGGKADTDTKTRLAFRARSTMPALRHVGHKAHEAHYAPRNIYAAFEIQEGGYNPISSVPSLGTADSERLLSALSSAFGYFKAGGILRRRCPSGGNLGSPEPLIWIAAEGRIDVYRYLPATNQLESVGEEIVHRQAQTRSEIGVLCLGNHEKLIRKYGDFGKSLVHIDGGLARSVFLTAAEAEGLGWELGRPNLELHPLVARLIAARESYYTVVWGVKLTPSTAMSRLNPGRALTRARLSRQLARRRAQRQFSEAGVGSRHFMRLVHRARPSDVTPIEAGLLQHLKAVVRVREGNVDHWFDLRPDGSLVDLPASHGGPELFLQRELDKAPLALFFLASLATLIDQHGVDAMDSLLLLSGQWVCNLWLSLDEVGLGGCPCGAGVESDLQAALPDSYARDSLLFSFVAGARLQ